MRRASMLEARRADPRCVYAGHALHAEWTKARTTGGTIWLLLGVIAATVALGGAVATATRCPAAGCGQDPAKVSLAGVDLGQAVVAVLAVLAIGGEYGTGMIRASALTKTSEAQLTGQSAFALPADLWSTLAAAHRLLHLDPPGGLYTGQPL